mmetsp:Transcript_6094/g.11278  ORF Transcript_6094/g.11278 Transcript_6094/m.11278 type:complete len:302 (-) Transcript_6094:315-1220(-)
MNALHELMGVGKATVVGCCCWFHKDKMNGRSNGNDCRDGCSSFVAVVVVISDDNIDELNGTVTYGFIKLCNLRHVRHDNFNVSNSRFSTNGHSLRSVRSTDGMGVGHFLWSLFLQGTNCVPVVIWNAITSKDVSPRTRDGNYVKVLLLGSIDRPCKFGTVQSSVLMGSLQSSLQDVQIGYRQTDTSRNHLGGGLGLFGGRQMKLLLSQIDVKGRRGVLCASQNLQIKIFRHFPVRPDDQIDVFQPDQPIQIQGTLRHGRFCRHDQLLQVTRRQWRNHCSCARTCSCDWTCCSCARIYTRRR